MAVDSIGLAPAPPSSWTATDEAQSELSCRQPAADNSAQMVDGETAVGVDWQALHWANVRPSSPAQSSATSSFTLATSGQPPTPAPA
jgi:hypothetical protein